MQQEPTTAGTGSSPRERFREQTRAEIKDIALRQLAEGGAESIALTRIAKEVGLSGPALYRYFASRDDLLTSLVRDAYDDLGHAIRTAAENAPAEPASALHALAGAFLTWAAEQPARYLLIQGTPVAGYSAPPDTVALAREVLGPLLPIFAAGEVGDDVRPLVEQMAAWLARDAELRGWVSEHVGPPGTDQRAALALTGAVLAWSQLHGTIGHQAAGHYNGMGHSARTLLAVQVDMLANTFRLDGSRAREH